MYNSCRDRHCPTCQTLTKERWLRDRKAELLPAPYFHLVFTLPHDLNPIILHNRRRTLHDLFDAVKETLVAFGEDPRWRLEGQIGAIAVLHTWSQTLIDHFHLHCLIPGGVLTREGKWKPASKKYLFRVESLAKAFQSRYLDRLIRAWEAGGLVVPEGDGFSDLLDQSRNKPWIVYAKRPFAGPEQVLEYLGRYTHRVAISNERIHDIGPEAVTFTYKDRQANQRKEMTLPVGEFIRRFLLHVLPKGFVKIRYFGFLSHRTKKEAVPHIRSLIGKTKTLPEKTVETVRDMMIRLTGEDPLRCPVCKEGFLEVLRVLPRQPIPDTS